MLLSEMFGVERAKWPRTGMKERQNEKKSVNEG